MWGESGWSELSSVWPGHCPGRWQRLQCWPTSFAHPSDGGTAVPQVRVQRFTVQEKALTLLPADALGQVGRSEEQGCHEQKSDQREEPNEHGQKVLDYEVRRSGGINMLWLSRRKYGKVIPPTTLEG
jgi:hypothetical protein